MIQASGGMATSLPIAVMTPWAITMVAFSTGGPETGTILAPRMAKYCGSPPCARIWGAAARSAKRVTANASANTHRRARTERMQAPFWDTFRTRTPDGMFSRRKRLARSYGRVKEGGVFKVVECRGRARFQRGPKNL